MDRIEPSTSMTLRKTLPALALAWVLWKQFIPAGGG